MNILGMVCETHDAGLAILENGQPAFVIEEERLNREKHTREFPALSLAAAFGSGRRISDIDVITTPWDMGRLRRSFFRAVMGHLPYSLSLLRPSAQPTQDHGIVLLNQWLRYHLKRTFPGERLPPILNVGHHEAHAAIFFGSPFEEASILVMDGYGDDAATSMFTGAGNKIARHWHGAFFDSLGMVYALITQHLGFRLFEEGTVMALAATGSDTYVAAMRDIVRLHDDGTFTINRDYFCHDTYGPLRPFTPRFLERFGPPRAHGSDLTDRHRDLAKALQTVTEEVVLHVARHMRKTYRHDTLVLAGGVALNCVANARLLQDTDFKRVWVPPCASDTGAPLGSALFHQHQTLGQPRSFELRHAYYGTQYGRDEIRAALDKAGLAYEELDETALLARVADDLADNCIVGWFQGRFEMGPRALGNRSILASPMRNDIREIINARIKYREPFRPFAPAVLEEFAHEYFEIDQADPFMTLAPRVRPDKRHLIPAAVHVDGTARIQTVNARDNGLYYRLIAAFMARTGVPIVINTSFNKQEPIVARPEEAISCYLRTEMDVLVIGNFYTRARPERAIAEAKRRFQVLEINTRGGE